MTQFAV